MNEITPEEWRELLIQDMARTRRLMEIQPFRRRHTEPPPADVQAAYDQWLEEWERVCATGRRNDWLVDDNEYGGLYANDLHPVLVWDETEEDFQARYKAWEAEFAPNGTITIPYKKETP